MIAMQTHGRGYTLIELLFTVAILGVLSHFSISSMQKLIVKINNDIAMQTTITTLDRARLLAVTRGKRVGVCLLDASSLCSSDWIGIDLGVFIDENRNRQRDPNERVIYRRPWPAANIRLRWSNWRSEPLITYQSNGSVISNGTLSFENSAGQSFAAIIISKPGRARIQ
jgi:type IV fimbrial biogenesis protein FimT